MTPLSRRHLLALAAVGPFAATASRAKAAPAPIDEGLFADINGVPQWITVRGQDRSNPVLLILHGGPGFPMSFMAPAFAAWERHFTVVQWDQPGGGATYSKNEGRDQGPLTIDRYVADGLAVAAFVRARLGARKLVLLGTSWGSMLGVMMIQRRPELFAAYVGASQVVSGPRGGKLGYELALQAARARGDKAAVAALEHVGPPPYARFEDFLIRQTYTNPPGQPPSPAEAAATAAQMRILMTPPPADAAYIARGLPPYDGGKVFMQTQRATFAETWAWEAADYGLTFKVPVFVIQGEDDLNAPVALARAWTRQIHAPRKDFRVIPGAGHNTLAFSDQVLALLDREVRPVALRWSPSAT